MPDYPIASRFLAVLATLTMIGSVRSEVVINEIFYNSPADLDRLEFVELYNTGNDEIAIGSWKFSKGIDYEFPTDATIKGNGYLVLCADQSLFRELYGITADGQFDKSISNGGETLTLKNADGKKVDSVKFDDKAPWPKSADGYSASLERICPTAKVNDAPNWAPSLLSDDYDSKPSGTPGQQNSVFAASLPPVIEEVSFASDVCRPDESITIQATIADVDSTLGEVQLCYRIATPGNETDETVLPMSLVDGSYAATIPGQEGNRIIRFRVKASNKEGDVRFHPHPNSIRPALSIYVNGGTDADKIPVAHFINVGETEFKKGADYKADQRRSRGGGRGGFDRGRFGGRREISEKDRLRMEANERLSDDALQKAWATLTLNQNLSAEKMLPVAKAVQTANKGLSDLRKAAADSKDVRGFIDGLDEQIKGLRDTLESETASILSAAQRQVFAGPGAEPQREVRGRRGFPEPSEMLQRFFNIEESWFRSAILDGVDSDQMGKLAGTHREAMATRDKLADDLKQGGDIDFREVMGDAMELGEDLRDAVAKHLTKDQIGLLERGRPGGFRPDFGRGRGGPGGRSDPQGTPLRPQGRSALIYTDPATGKAQFFDFINITERKSGYKVRLHKDRPLNGMTTLNVLYEPGDRTTVNEALAYDLYRQSGNATVESGFVRVLIDGEVAGYHLWFEQPNGTFFRRHEIDDSGNLYKLIWMGSHSPSKFTPTDKIPDRMDIVGRHEKVTNPHDGYDDIVGLIETLENANGDDAKMWQVIQANFDVDQVINYFAVNSLLSHWDGFFNNYFLYHDTKGTEKWTMYPWDQDSTWSTRMGSPDELSRLPINYGAEGARPPGAEGRNDEDNQRGRDRGRGRGGFRGFGGGRGGPGWWRDGGDISRPLLANPEFSKRFRARLKILAATQFNEEVFGTKIEALQAMIEPEVRLRAKVSGSDQDSAVRSLEDTIATMREHLELRRAYVLQQLAGVSE